MSTEPKTDPIESWALRRDESGLAGATAEEIAASVEAFADRAERAHPDLDADQLVSTGFAVARSGRADPAGTAAIDWLLRAPSAPRLEIASLIMSGLWVRVASGPRVVPAHVAGLIEARRQAPFDETANAASLLALGATLFGSLSPSLRALIVEELRTAAAEPRVSSALREYLLKRIAATG